MHELKDIHSYDYSHTYKLHVGKVSLENDNVCNQLPDWIQKVVRLKCTRFLILECLVSECLRAYN